jgi:hypothetical protein
VDTFNKVTVLYPMDIHPVRTLPRVLKSFRKFSDLPSRFCGFTEIKICTVGLKDLVLCGTETSVRRARGAQRSSKAGCPTTPTLRRRGRPNHAARGEPAYPGDRAAPVASQTRSPCPGHPSHIG